MPSDSAARPCRARGFTLVELMVTVAILALLLSLAAPSFALLISANRLTTMTNELVGSLQLARSEAVRRVQNVSLAAAGSGAAGYASGWTVFPDANGDGIAASATSDTDGRPIRQLGPFTGSIVVTKVDRVAHGSGASAYDTFPTTATSPTAVVFGARGGITSTEADFKICDSAHPEVPARIVRITVVGRVSLYTPAGAPPASCP